MASITFLITGLTLLLNLPSQSPAETVRWGQIGHYVTGKIAEQYITDKAEKELKRVLGQKSLAAAAAWMDDIRSDPDYDYASEWHWVTIPPGMTYEDAEKNPEGDIIEALERKISELAESVLSRTEEQEKLMMVIHMVGDIHQPLHVGTGEDRGGNDVDVQWIGESSNLHSVWDSRMIDSYQLSFTELAAALEQPSEKDIRDWQQSTVRDWAAESAGYRDDVYDLPDNGQIGYVYRYANFELVERRLLQAGIRLAGVINGIYDQADN
ncbi:MAG: S1/P1 nuclease [Balneolaceae bacterium]